MAANLLNSNLSEFNGCSDIGFEQVNRYPAAGEKLMKNRKPIRKQTSFASTNEKSDNYSAADIFDSRNVRITQQSQTLESIDDDGVLMNSNAPKRAIKMYSIDSCHMDDDENKNKSNLSNNIEQDVKMVGLLTEAQRMVKVQNYLDKKKTRFSENNVRYGCRQQLASNRFRFQGRFIRIEDLHKFKGKFIIDFYGKRLLKPIFDIVKTKRSTT